MKRSFSAFPILILAACLTVGPGFAGSIFNRPDAAESVNNPPEQKGQLRPPLATYRIYHEADAQASIVLAATQLQSHLEKVLGKKLAIVHAPETPMIALGATELARKAGFDASELPWEAAQIATHNDDIFIVGKDLPEDGRTPLGGRSYGTLYGSFAFLEQVAGIRWLMPGEHGTFLKSQPDLRVADLDWVEKPGLEYRRLDGICTVGNNWLLHHRFDQDVPFDLPRPLSWPLPPGARAWTGGSLDFGCGHYWDYLFPAADHPFAAYFDDRDKTYASNPGLFAMSKGGERIKPASSNIALCMSSPEFNDEVARRVGIVMDREGVSTVSIWPIDGVPNCYCEDCQESLIVPDKRYYAEVNSDSQWSAVVFDTYRGVSERIAKTHPDKIVTGGLYYAHEVPYEDMPPLPENFMGEMAPLRVAYGPQRLAPEFNQVWHNLLEDWGPLTSNTVYASYDFWFRDYTGAPMPPYIELMRDTFSTIDRLGYRGAEVFAMVGYGRNGVLNYMLAKMLWDPSRDPEALFNEFCDAAYGAGAGDIKDLYRLVDTRMKNFFVENIQDKIHYNVYPELLRDVYGAAWPKIQASYLQALEAVQGDVGATWRVEQLGVNLKLLYFHLGQLGLVEADENSPLFMSKEEAAAFNTSDLRRAPWAAPVNFSSPHRKEALQPVNVVQGAEISAAQKEVGPFWLRYHQDLLIAPEHDGLVTVDLVFETDTNKRTGKAWLPDIPYYSIYELDKPNETLVSGIATAVEGGRQIQFQGEKGKLYVLIVSSTGRYLSNSRYTVRHLNAPWALGTGTKPLGLLLHSGNTPLYFYVPAGLDDFELRFRGAPEVEIYDPNGKLITETEKTGSPQISVDASDSPAGFWSIRFPKPNKWQTSILQDPRLGGYFTVDPSRPVALAKKETSAATSGPEKN